MSENHEACTHVIVASDSSTVSMYSPRVRVVKQEVSLLCYGLQSHSLLILTTCV